ncbi:unnamed protein product [Dibothriocephalus latus]|uniref:Major facilitator superfamily (MFS) profile domain-containing protein n=1 Tax=Dibothriocephalus latus TaxID=60516 RepID=A0A3P7P3W5_DIBLA|nr:unnamed protein product [Dibothriocephalus latus]
MQNGSNLPIGEERECHSHVIYNIADCIRQDVTSSLVVEPLIQMLKPELEKWFRNASKLRGNRSTELQQFEDVARVLGPLAENRALIGGCELYSFERLENDTHHTLLELYENASHSGKAGTPCPYGYVYKYTSFQYQGGIVQEWDLVCDKAWQVPLNESAYMAGMLMGYICGGWLSDRIGRRRTMLYSGLIEIALNVAICFCPNHLTYIILRFLVSTFFTTRTSAFIVLLTEITTAKYRSILSAIGTILQLSIQRVLLGVSARYFTNWRVLYAVSLAPNALVLFSPLCLPESPKWLAAQKSYRPVGEVLYSAYQWNRRFRNACCLGSKPEPVMKKEEFLDRLGISAPSNDAASRLTPSGEEPGGKTDFSILHLFHRGLRGTTILTTALLTCQITTMFGITFYASHIRQHVSMVVIINALANIPGALLAAALYRFFRYRKKPLAAVFFITVLFLCAAAVHTLLLQPKSDHLLNILTNISIFFFSAAQRMIFVYVPELFQPLYRNRGFGIAAGLSRIGALSFPLINRLDTTVLHGLPLAVYATLTACQLLILFFVEDTNGEGVVVTVQSPSPDDPITVLEVTPLEAGVSAATDQNVGQKKQSLPK